MLTSTLDGFLAGILLGPDLVPPNEWLPHVWGEPEGGAMPLVGDLAEAGAVVTAVMGHYNTLATLFARKGGYAPILEDDPRTEEILWEVWAEGFGQAVDLRPGSWLRIAKEGSAETQAALAGLMSLVALSQHETDLSDEAAQDLTLRAPDLIPGWVETLNAWRLAHASAPAPVAGFGKAGRNDPCPCGSGRKYKKCCGAA